MRFTITGPYKAVVGTLAWGARKGLRKTADFYLERFCGDVAQHLTDGIKSQSFKMPPLLPGTLRTSGSSVPLIDTGTYVNSIHVIRDEKGFRVGPSEHNVSPRTRVALDEIAEFMEFGTKHIPARPHWRPTMKWAKDNIGPVGRAIIGDVIKLR